MVNPLADRKESVCVCDPSGQGVLLGRVKGSAQGSVDAIKVRGLPPAPPTPARV